MSIFIFLGTACPACPACQVRVVVSLELLQTPPSQPPTYNVRAEYNNQPVSR